MQFEHIVDVHLEQGRLAEVELGPTLYEEDSNGLKLGVRLWKNGEAVDVTGTVSGWAIVSTGQTISPFDDTGYDGNEAWVLVPQGALVPGRIEIFLRITGDSDSAVTLHATATVRRTKTGAIIVPGDPLPGVDQLRQIAADCVAATEAAEELTTNAVQYTAQTKDAAAQAVARGNIGAAGDDHIHDTLLGLTGFVDYGRGTYQDSTGITPSVNLSAIGDGMSLVLDTNGGQMGGGSVVAYCRLNGGFKYYNTMAQLANSGDAKVRLTNGHRYRLYCRHISGDWQYASGQEVLGHYVNVYRTNGSSLVALSAGHRIADGSEANFVYREGTDYPDGVYIVLAIRRTSGSKCKFDNLHIAIGLEDLGAAEETGWEISPNHNGNYIAVAADATAVTMEDGVPKLTSTTAAYYCYLAECAPGDTFTVRGVNRLSTIPGFLFIAEDGTILMRGFSSSSVSERKIVVAPENTKFVYFLIAINESADNKLWCGVNTDEPFTLRGSALTIDAVSGGRYMCGTLDSLSFTPSSSGLCEVIFTSGTTATVLTLPSSVRMPDWWSGVETNRTYDIMVLDGTLAGVMSWAT